MDYNPHRPHIVGQEWVPIREEPNAVDLIYAPAGTTEYGNSFTLTAAKALQEARLYTAGLNGGLGLLANVYPLGNEVEAGPVHRVLIPVNNGALTGTNTSFVGGANAAACLLTPDDTNYVKVPFNATASPPDTTYFRAYFAVNQYAQLLNGKRILQVNVLYALSSNIQQMVDTYTPSANATIDMNLKLSLNNDFLSNSIGTASASWTNPGVVVNTNFQYDEPSDTHGETTYRVGLGNISLRSTAPFTFPWVYADLARFEISASDRLAIQFGTSVNRGDSVSVSSNVANNLHYMALEVFYCDETRVAVGFNDVAFSTRPEVQTVTMYDLNKGANPILQAGAYRATIATGLYLGIFAVPTYSFPLLPGTAKALRELYTIPTFDSTKILIPNPFDETIEGKVLTQETTHLIPQISLHTTGGAIPFTEIHPYGNQAVGKVYGTVTATQVVQDSVLVASGSYPQVRYYARRFGGTTIPLKLDSTVITGSSVSITPAAFDDLPEIIDGWKEVTLRFATAPTLGAGTNPAWRWSATGETAGNRWEVLGAAAPAISALPGNFINEVASTQRLGSATYGAPAAGTTVAMAWVPGISPLVSATTTDAMSDAALLFSMDMPSITGFTVVTTNQPLTGIGLNCASSVGCCQPTGLSFNRLDWTPPYPVICDQFDRTVASGWGSIVPGLSWTVTGVGATTSSSVNGSQGLLTMSTAGGDMWAAVGDTTSLIDYDMSVQFTIASLAGNPNTDAGFLSRLTDFGNFYRQTVSLNPITQVTSLIFAKRVAASFSTVASVNVGIVPADNLLLHMRAQGQGSLFKIKVWQDGFDEPDWQIIAVDTSLTTGKVGLDANDGLTTVTFDNFLATPYSFIGAYYELQRLDNLDSDWHSIMKATELCTKTFNDYEARVGLQSQYRIRAVNGLEFAGSWSSTVSLTMAAPGVTGGSCISTGHVLIFTSNEHQNGSINLAYSEAWMGSSVVEEPFSFPEAGQNVVQMMFDKDFPTIFRPSERGGETFQRTLLVQAAAISPPTAGDFRALRDMAWDDVAYVCVRDEDGNRWFATVIVPDGNIMRDRRLYLATINVIETSKDPFLVVVE